MQFNVLWSVIIYREIVTDCIHSVVQTQCAVL